MTSPLQAGGSLAAGVLLALFAVLGGVSALTPTANSAEQSDGVVLYDAP